MSLQIESTGLSLKENDKMPVTPVVFQKATDLFLTHLN